MGVGLLYVNLEVTVHDECTKTEPSTKGWRVLHRQNGLPREAKQGRHYV